MADALTVELDWRAWRTRFVLFTGKGGVGKTTIAAATAVALADARAARPARVDRPGLQPRPTSSRCQQRDIRSRCRSLTGLEVMDLDPQEAAEHYRSRVIAPYRGALPETEIAALEEKLAGACTVEVAAFDTFARLLVGPRRRSDRFDQVLFDTAPTGHTLRLLSLPAAWSGYLVTIPTPPAVSARWPVSTTIGRSTATAVGPRAIPPRPPSSWWLDLTEAPSPSPPRPQRSWVSSASPIRRSSSTAC